MEGNPPQNGKFSQLPHTITDLNLFWSYVIGKRLYSHGVQDWIICPGMRNAPFIKALCSLPELNLKSIVDERSAGMMALGLAKKKQTPVGLVCTSGTALSHYFPAIIEAYKTQIPLVIVSADRPIELIKGNANQTIYQNSFYGSYVYESLNLSAPNEQLSAIQLQGLIDQAACQLQHNKLPIHINLPFREPLDGTGPLCDPRQFSSGDNKLITQNKRRERSQMTSLPAWQDSLNPLLVVGEIHPWTELKALKSYIEQYTGACFLDVSSRLKYDFSLEDQLVPSFDHGEVFRYFTENPPDCILHIGGGLISKHYYRFLQENPLIPVIQINDSHLHQDPALRGNLIIKEDPHLWAGHALEQNVFPQGLELKHGPWPEFTQTKAQLINNSELISTPSLSKMAIELLPEAAHVFIGNSTLIRAFDNFIHPKLKKNLHIFTQRGVSGIEGNLSHAYGIASEALSPTYVFLGDISTIHDFNFFFELAKNPIPMTIVIANNQGGGIFNLLHIKNGKQIIPFLTTPHQMVFTPILEAMGLSSTIVSTNLELKKELCRPPRPTPQIIEAIIDDEFNQKMYHQLKTIRP